jgi:hypothetical protein
VERRYPEEGETGSFYIRSDEPHAVGGPPRLATDLPVEGQAAAQIAAALLARKVNAELPSWVLSGFGRATVLQAGPAEKRAAENRKALQLWSVKKKTAADAWSGALDPADAAVLRGSVVGYLAYSGRTTRFVPFVMAFRPEENRPEPTTADALKAAEIAPESLNKLWLKWVATGK